ncbi:MULTISPECIES: Uma2 family endonuclease [Streptomyces]|uniref:Uma2 family endonuclease n=1 Tax=Streptomyces TaxID=1883 RepID=UPI00141DA4C6|nr:Uma2 family endonuclease [Streptomyces sp. MBT27]
MSAAREYKLDGEYQWPRPPVGGWTADDLDRLPNLPPHTELIDGILAIMSPQTWFHMRTMRLLEHAFVAQAPEHLAVIREMTIKLDHRNRPEPDVLIVPSDVITGPRQTWFEPKDVLLAVEVVSADSVARDREVKPGKYARAGVQHFWRVEENDGLPVVYVFELDPATRAYSPIGTFRKELKVDLPFPIEIDLTAPDRRR